MFVRPTAFRRPAVSEDEPPRPSPDTGKTEPPGGLTRAQARALSRCAPLTPTEFKARRHAADQGLVSLRGVLSEDRESSRP